MNIFYRRVCTLNAFDYKCRDYLRKAITIYIIYYHSYLFAFLKAFVGFMYSSSHLLVLKLAQFALWVPQTGHHASC